MLTKTTQSKKISDRFAHYFFEAHNIGEWDGEEILAAKQLNYMLATLNKVLPESVGQREINALYIAIWEDWSVDTRILNASNSEISSYAIESLLKHTTFDTAVNI